MASDLHRAWHHRFAVFTTLCTIVLVAIGGLVTSKGVGMAVPDWPTTYGYNLFFFPIDRWTGGVFHEHVHRLAASYVGFLTVVLAVWTQWRDDRRWVRRLAWAALGVVLVQGLLGGLRVILNSQVVMTTTFGTLFGLAHATTAQVFLSLVGLVALATSRAWRRWEIEPPGSALPWLPRATALIVGLIFVQLLVAATMRHQHAGLAVTGFPLAFDHYLYPPTDAGFVARLNQQRTGILPDEAVTAFQIHLQMLHRFLAVAIVGAVGWVGWRLLAQGGLWARWGGVWVGLLLVQFSLGAATIWTNKAADIATAHVAVGAGSLLTGVLLLAVSRRVRFFQPEQVGSCPRASGILQARPATPLSRGTGI